MSEIVVQDFGGKHNGDMAGTSARLLKGGSWKRQRVIVVLPADAMIPAKVALSHWNLIFPPNNGVVRLLALGMEVGDAYSKAIESVLAHPDLKDWEFLCTLEHDNLPPQDGVLALIETLENHPEFSAASSLYFTRGEGGVAQAWGDPRDPQLNFRPQVPRVNEIMEVCGIGMGMAIFRLSMFKDARLAKPWFKTQKGPGGVSTQDLAFWSDARKYGYRCCVDCRVRTGHMEISTGMIW